MIYWPSKPAAVVRDQGLNWSPTLAKIARLLVIPQPTIVNSVWTRLHGSASIGASELLPDGMRVLARVSGGLADEVTMFRNTVTLSNGFILVEDVFQKVRA